MGEQLDNGINKLLGDSELARRIAIWLIFTLVMLVGSFGWFATSWAVHWMQNKWNDDQARLLAMEQRLQTIGALYVSRIEWEQARARRDIQIEDLHEQVLREQARIDRLQERFQGQNK